MALIRVEFEVFGRVQGVFFRKVSGKTADIYVYNNESSVELLDISKATQNKAIELGIKGWCMNTDKETVRGELQGVKPKVEQMKIWLSSEGSKASKIEKAVFSNEQPITDFSFPSFEIVKHPPSN